MMELLGLQLHIIIGWWVVGILAAVVVVGLTLLYWGSWRFEFLGEALAFVGGLLLIGAVLFQVVAHVPFDSKYWNLYAVQGVVESVEATFTVDDGHITNNYIVSLVGDDTPYRVTDPRVKNASGVLDLTCSIEWVYQGADRVNCVIGVPERAA